MLQKRQISNVCMTSMKKETALNAILNWSFSSLHSPRDTHHHSRSEELICPLKRVHALASLQKIPFFLLQHMAVPCCSCCQCAAMCSVHLLISRSIELLALFHRRINQRKDSGATSAWAQNFGLLRDEITEVHCLCSFSNNS